MIPNPFFITANLNDVPYILPYGQNIADHLKGFSTNEAGGLIWDAFRNGKNTREILSLLAANFEVPGQDLSPLRKDTEAFLASLASLNPAPEAASLFPAAHPKRLVKIGPLTVSLQVPEAFFQKYFSAFSCGETEDPATALSVVLCRRAPLRHENGRILLRNEEILIMEAGEKYILLPRNSALIYEIHVEKNGRSAAVFCACDPDDDPCGQELFHALRFIFLVTAQQHDLCVIHSASLLHNGKAWLFSGHSGAGKSTHTRLWQKLFDAEILNGDLNMIGLENGNAVCYGLPWCGTSGISTGQSYPLEGIVFLKQAPENQVQTLSPDQEILYLSQHLITPCWTEELLRKNLALCGLLAEKIRIFKLLCNMEPEAALKMREAIDAGLFRTR